jgi:hypothetical protein
MVGVHPDCEDGLEQEYAEKSRAASFRNLECGDRIELSRYLDAGRAAAISRVPRPCWVKDTGTQAVLGEVHGEVICTT